MFIVTTSTRSGFANIVNTFDTFDAVVRFAAQLTMFTPHLYTFRVTTPEGFTFVMDPEA